MTTKGEWVAYTGDSKQIAKLKNQRNGFIYRYVEDGKTLESQIEYFIWHEHLDVITHYWIIPDDPLRKMKVRQAHTGQPVWVRIPLGYANSIHLVCKVRRHDTVIKDTGEVAIMVTTAPDWNIPNAEYSFTAFEE